MKKRMLLLALFCLFFSVSILAEEKEEQLDKKYIKVICEIDQNGKITKTEILNCENKKKNSQILKTVKDFNFVPLVKGKTKLEKAEIYLYFSSNDISKMKTKLKKDEKKVEMQGPFKKVFVPIYPEIAREMGLEGKVKVRCETDENGKVINVRLMESSGNDIMDSAALNGARKCIFKKRGTVTFSYIFDLRHECALIKIDKEIKE